MCPKWCQHHIPREDKRQYKQCKGSTQTGCRCKHDSLPNKEYCKKHLYLENLNDDDYRIDNRRCIYCDSSESGSLVNCRKFARSSGYTCSTHRKEEDDLIENLNLPSFEEFNKNFEKLRNNYKEILWDL